jgi:hypothetical protein
MYCLIEKLVRHFSLVPNEMRIEVVDNGVNFPDRGVATLKQSLDEADGSRPQSHSTQPTYS